MKKILLAGICCLLTGCSGVAPEAQRDESNKLLQPPFMDQDIKLMQKNQAEKQEDTTSKPMEKKK